MFPRVRAPVLARAASTMLAIPAILAILAIGGGERLPIRIESARGERLTQQSAPDLRPTQPV